MAILNLNTVTEALASKGLKITHQRIVVYQELISTIKHPSAETIYEKIKKNSPSISLATVYKVLEAFVEKGLAKRVSTPKGSMRYDGRVDDHSHIFISNTNEILDFEDEELKEILGNYLKRKKFQNLSIKDIKLLIRGEKVDTKKKVEIY